MTVLERTGKRPEIYRNNNGRVRMHRPHVLQKEKLFVEVRAEDVLYAFSARIVNKSPFFVNISS
jgi:hypothetical protein